MKIKEQLKPGLRQKNELKPLVLILKKNSSKKFEIERKFEKDSVIPYFNKIMGKLQKNIKLTPADNYIKKLSEKVEIKIEEFTKYRPVQWYWDIFGVKIIDELKTSTQRSSPKNYYLFVKFCNGYQYIELYRKNGEKKELVFSPYFHKEKDPSISKDEIKRGREDTLLLFLFDTSNENYFKKNSEGFEWIEFHLKANAKKINSESCSLELSALPTDKNSHEIKFKNKSMLLISHNFRKALSKLAESWQTPGAKSILLNAWTGSGKEVLKDFYQYAVETKDGNNKNGQIFLEFSAPELANNEKPINVILDQLKKEKLINKENELAKEVILFFDEIHHDESEKLRKILLRFMEDEKLYDEKKNRMVNFKKKVRFIFAASEQLDKITNKKPLDFWNRIEINVTMEHPLNLGEKREIKEAIKDYFILFWDQFYNENGKCIELFKKNPNLKKRLSEKFADEFDSPLIPLISIRHFRSIVKSLFRKITDEIITNAAVNSDFEIHIKTNFPDWINEICRDILPKFNTHGAF